MMVRVVLLLVLIAFGTQTTAAQKTDLKKFENNWESEKQPTTTHREGDTLRFVQRLNLDDFGLFNPELIEVDSSGNLITFDFGIDKIIYFKSGDFSHYYTIGDGKGRGPREFLGAFSMKFTPEGNIWVSDSDLNRLSLWNPDGQLLTSFVPKNYTNPGEIAVCDNQTLYIFSLQYWRDGILHLYDFEGQHLNTFQKVENRDEQIITFSYGNMTCHAGDLFVAGVRKEYIRRYNPKGDLVFSKSVQDFKPNEQIVETRMEGKTRHWSPAPKVRRASGELQALGDELFVAFGGRMNRWHYNLDVYNANNGNYLRSYAFAVPIRFFAIHEDRIYTMEYAGEEAATRYNLGIYEFPDHN